MQCGPPSSFFATRPIRRPLDDPIVLLEQETIERPFGWIFFYESKKFRDTGTFGYKLLGNVPVLVHRRGGAAEFFGTTGHIEPQLAEYERRLADNG